jgi:small subunit ribosomal protein S1
MIESENFKNVQPIEDFNWDAYEKGDSLTDASKEELVSTYDQSLNKINDKEVVMGTVTAMNKREVVVNIGYKSDGVVSMNEFRYNTDLKIGDEVEVYIESQEDKRDNSSCRTKKRVSHARGNVLIRRLRRTKSSRAM